MDPNQAKIVELLREVHAITVKEIERLNLRIAELENQNRHVVEMPTKRSPVNPTERPAIDNLPSADMTSRPDQREMLNEVQVADCLSMSVAVLRKWRGLRTGPKFVKIGKSVRYRRVDLEAWLDSCAGVRLSPYIIVSYGSRRLDLGLKAPQLL